MSDHSPSRRSALRGLGYVLGAGVVSLDWPALARAAHEAHQVAQSTAPATYTLLVARDAADVDALCAQIVPSGDGPGAREAGAAIFIDRALGSFFAHWRDGFMEGLRGFQAACLGMFPSAGTFAALDHQRQVDFLHTVDTTPFFEQARTLTLCAMFSSPKYGGNRDGIGWKLIGFEDQHVFEPPFGYYDRDYPGDIEGSAS
ncbi:MAG TPA: gluconate 2-dehydrogenase subunit 3 family protein [Steroidobacteraceae bacterium]|nr:gluconate 2-dehydrogenase subunit 3 family protein [Steroidobacteraceae bacterium]